MMCTCCTRATRRSGHAQICADSSQSYLYAATLVRSVLFKKPNIVKPLSPRQIASTVTTQSEHERAQQATQNGCVSYVPQLQHVVARGRRLRHGQPVHDGDVRQAAPTRFLLETFEKPRKASLHSLPPGAHARLGLPRVWKLVARRVELGLGVRVGVRHGHASPDRAGWNRAGREVAPLDLEP